MLQDIRYALRLFRRSPGFALAAIVTFALGIGANTAIFSLVDAAILRPLPYDAPDRIVTFVWQNPTTGQRRAGTTPREYLDLRTRTDIFDQVALTAGGLFTLLGAGEPEEVRIARVTAGYFEMLRATPALGRTFTEVDEQPQQPRVTIISHQFWKTRFAGAADVVGKVLRLDNQPYEIVGVLPASFQYPAGAEQQTRIFLPFMFTDADRQRGTEQSMGYNPQARLHAGLTIAQAEGAMAQFQASVDRDHVGFNKGYTRVTLTPLLETYVGDAREWMLMLLGAVVLVLLIACANVANLVLAQGTTRQRELTVRGALGASRWRIARQLLSESLLLSSLGAASGVVVAWWGIGLLRSMLPASIPRAADIGLDARVLGFTTIMAIATGLVCGLLPAVQRSRLDFVRGLKDAAPAVTSGHTGQSVRRFLASLEIALAVMLLVGAGLFIRSFVRLLNVDQGFDPSGIVAMRVSGSRSADASHLRIQMLDTLAAIRAVPGVQVALTDTGGPYTSATFAGTVRIDGREVTGSNQAPDTVRFRTTTMGFLEMLRVPLLRGRLFGADDTPQSTPVAVVNMAAARRFWGDTNPLGRSIEIAGLPTCEVVGIIGDMRFGGPTSTPAPEVFLPYEQAGRSAGTFLFRGPAGSLAAIKAAIWRVSPDQPIGDPQTAEDMLGRATASRRFNLLVMSFFAALALTIAATGIYGVIAFVVSQRTREVGLRVALGAQRSQILTLFLSHGARLLAAGLAVGLLGAWWLASTLREFLFQIEPRDVTVFVAVTVLLAIVGLVACWIPSQRAARMDPLRALRTE
jgi:putative ABC transport system permease protein